MSCPFFSFLSFFRVKCFGRWQDNNRGRFIMSPKINLEEFARTAERIREKAKAEDRLLDNPSDEVLRALVEKEEGVVKTIYNNFVAQSEPTSRSQQFTKNSVDDDFGEDELKLLQNCEQALAKGKIISIDRIVGNPSSKTIVRLIIPVEFAHVAYGGKNLFIPAKQPVSKPDYHIIFFGDEAWQTNKSRPLPQKDITIRLALLDDGRVVKIVRNSNYIGEYKKGVFASEDWVAKTRRGGIFLHGGCRGGHLPSSPRAYPAGPAP